MEDKKLIYVVSCDDDRNDLNIVSDILSDIFTQYKIDYDLQLFLSSMDLLENVKKVDIALLDISMDQINGIELGMKLKVKFPNVKIIYTTSYKQYCMQAINNIHAFSFLCKPLEKGELENQISDLLKKLDNADDISKLFYKVSNTEGREFPVLKFKLKDILYFEYIKTKRRIAIILNNEQYEFSYVMDKLSKELEVYGFVVNCRGSLVNLRHIIKIKGYDIYMDNGETLILSQKRAVEFKEKMNIFIHNNI